MTCVTIDTDNEDEECKVERNQTCQIINLPEWLYTRIGETLLPLAEKWAGTKLVFNNNYGIRRYLRGGKMLCHVDKLGEKPH